MKRQQNEQMIATHQQLAAAMTLPQPKVHKCKRDPILWYLYHDIQSTDKI